jgi:hypothetical protein
MEGWNIGKVGIVEIGATNDKNQEWSVTSL